MCGDVYEGILQGHVGLHNGGKTRKTKEKRGKTRDTRKQKLLQ